MLFSDLPRGIYMCRQLRSDIGYPWKPFLQGHSWWHVLTGTGVYIGVLFRYCFV